MTITITHYNDASVIDMTDASGFTHGEIDYTSKAHKPLSKMDFDLLKVQNNTYDDDQVIELFDYLQASR